jgi:hypothetical protein
VLDGRLRAFRDARACTQGTVSGDPEAAFTKMAQKGIGRSRGAPSRASPLPCGADAAGGTALFWHGYALMLEDKERWDEAARMYHAGIAANAEPVAKLQQALESFMCAVVAAVLSRVLTQLRRLRRPAPLSAPVIKPPSPKAAAKPALKPAAAPATREDGSVAMYSQDAVSYNVSLDDWGSSQRTDHFSQGEEISFEEYRAMCMERAAQKKALQTAAVAAVTAPPPPAPATVGKPALAPSSQKYVAGRPRRAVGHSITAAPAGRSDRHLAPWHRPW